MLEWAEAIKSARLEGLGLTKPEQIPARQFVPKYPELDQLDSYRGDLGEQYWSKWPVVQFTRVPASWIDGDEMVRLARELKHPDMARVSRVASWLKQGADLGARGAGRLPAEGVNQESCYEHGFEMLDALRAWTESKTVIGPLRREEAPPGLRISPMSVEIKPNGRARVIIDMSWPHLDDPQLDSQDPISVNSSIRKEDYPAFMVTSQDVLELLFLAGWKCFLSKCDWNDAYKHCSIRAEDVHLQVINLTLDMGNRPYI